MSKSERSELIKLVKKYKHRPDRKGESDCSVTQEIIHVYDKGDEKARRHIIRWMLKRLKHKDTNALVRNMVIGFLYKNRKELNKEDRKRFKEIVRSSKKLEKAIQILKRKT